MSIFLLRLAAFCCLLLESCSAESAKDVYVKECQGSSTGLSYSGSAIERYETYRRLYSDCTLVTMNLEIVSLDLTGDQYDLSFLENVREVNGYVLIHGNHVTRIRLNRLRVIRGSTLYKGQEQEGNKERFSLYVSENALPGHESVGLKELQMPSLAEILDGEVLFRDNRQLCFGESTIDWVHLLNGRGGLELTTINRRTKPGYEKINCHSRGTCHESCPASEGNQKYCWASGADKCQNVQKCSGCGSNKRCSLQNESECCHSECVAGCNRANSTEHCLSCRNYSRNKGKSCLQSCSEQVYDEGKASWVTPPDKFVQGSRCVKECDEDMVLQDGICSFGCKKGFMKNKRSSPLECIPCRGDCPTTCDGTSNWLRWGNLFYFSECKKVNGSIYINNVTFTGNDGAWAVAPKDLEELSGVEEITGSLVIDACHREFTSLHFLRKLRVIGGNGPTLTSAEQRGLFVSGTSLTSIHLNSFESVSNGEITFADNPQLCFVEGINWTTIKAGGGGGGGHHIRNNRMSTQCYNEGFNCSSMCLPDNGCMGKENDSCITCQDFRLIDGHCSNNCSTQNGFYEKQGIRVNRECRPCDEQCNGSCNGDGPRDCLKCKHVKHNDVCVSECPPQMYADADALCQPCNSLCNNCTGNGTALGNNGCSNCTNRVIRFDEENTGHCIASADECNNETFFRKEEKVEAKIDGKTVNMFMKTCRRCHEECVGGCSGTGSSNCRQCRNYDQTSHTGRVDCVANCSGSFYDAGNDRCLPCHPQCLTCLGPTEYDCHACRTVRVLPTAEDAGNFTNNKSFCAEECPKGFKRNKADHDIDYICLAPERRSGFLTPQVAIPVFVVSFLIIVVVIIISVVFWRRHMRKRMWKTIVPENDIPLISSSKAKPDMALLRLIVESELRCGKVIGSGAFGTVYQGIWIPEKDNVKIPVAIKVLQDNANTNLNVELLDEARIMASVCHPNCVRILAVCMTAQMMLVTQLMPLGCLLDYVRKEKPNIGSRALLLWSVQIAKGMKHLEELGIVHRDLAARNVLVQSPHQVKITDFGLAKLLDYTEEEIHSEGGKMPIKWLALECIQHRIYTHKSDVWSYGVTLWEMFSYGDRPYELLPARQVPWALEKGERLPQPPICTLDVYTVMMKCWKIDADDRPTFSQLIDEFTRMAANPGRFLVIHGDGLMRLPSQTPDACDLIRLMSLEADEPDLKVVSGEEYLRPMDLECAGRSSYLVPLSSIPEGAESDGTFHGNGPTSFQVNGDDGGYLSPKSVTCQSGDPGLNYLNVIDAGSPAQQTQQQYLDMNVNTCIT